MRDRAGGKIARNRSDDGAGELGAEVVIGVARKIGAKIFVCVARGEIGFQQALDRFRHFVGGAAVANLARDARVCTHGAAEAEVIGVDEIASLLDFFAFEADVRDPMLAAGVGAAGDI